MIGNINSIETMGLVDGPGIRVVVFLQGCPLRCLYCHNPEMWNNKKHMQMTAEELVEKILKYKNYFKDLGGVTFSGGEPLNQPEFLIEALKLCKQNNINTAIDTSGVGNSKYEEILKYTDLVILDIKSVDKDKYKYLTSYDIDKFLNFLDICQKLNKDIWLRQVIVPTINDKKEDIYSLKKFIAPLKNIKKIELLPYHSNGISKYEKLNISYKLKEIPDMSKKKLDELYQILIED